MSPQEIARQQIAEELDQAAAQRAQKNPLVSYWMGVPLDQFTQPQLIEIINQMGEAARDATQRHIQSMNIIAGLRK